MDFDGRTPVILGVGQASEAIDRPGYAARSPAALAACAVHAAIADCAAAGDVADAADTVAAIRQFEISTPFATAPFGRADNLPRAVAGRVGARPARAILGITGGQANQALVGELACEIAAGRSDLAILFGAEAISTMRHLQASGAATDWSEHTPGTLEDRGYGIDDLFDAPMLQAGVAAPIPCHALLENARRARLGLDTDAYRLAMGALFAPFTTVAAANPHAAARTVLSATELATVSARNRIVAEPYTRLLVARDQVNQAACVILASADRARALGTDPRRWVHLHASVTAREPSPMQRPDVSRSPQAVACIRRSLSLAGIGMEDLDAMDLYSCFPVAVFNVTDAFGLSADDPRGLTLTGGLPFFGGAGNNYSMHAIAEAVARLRAGTARRVLVGANGGFLSKYAAGIYAMDAADWRDPAARVEALADDAARVRVAETAPEDAVLETFTILPGQDAPERAAMFVRGADGARSLVVDTDPVVVERLRAGKQKAGGPS